jgi:triosephosphate isomerase (TIM)
MKLIVGNWKMYPQTLREAKTIYSGTSSAARKTKNVKVVACPPFPFISMLAREKKGAALGAQDVFWESEGARTGEVSSEQLRSSGASYVIVGHSERRGLGEADDIVAKKAVAAAKSGLTVILCVGERERDHDGKYFGEVRDELRHSISGFPKQEAKKLSVAYEPIWAIGAKAKRAATIDDFREMRILIRRHLVEYFGKKAGFTIPILYGGSVDEKNAGGFLGEGEADGLLVGRASLDIERFAAIITQAKAS